MSRVYHDNLNYHFLEGIFYLYKRQLPKAAQCFLKAVNETKTSEHLYGKYLSYFGLVEALRKSKGGLIHAYEAANKEFTMETLLNLAVVEHCSGLRLRCLKSINTGLKIMPENELFLIFQNIVGIRARPRPFSLKRNHALKRYVGRLHFQKRRKPATDDEIFEFVQDIIYSEYRELKPGKQKIK